MLSIKKKSQSALEFLVTYAWAFIVIAIIIAAIAYFGVLRPQKILPDRCTFSVSFDCSAFSLSTDGSFRLRLKNNVGTSVTVSDLNLVNDAGADFACILTGLPPSNWGLGEVQDIEWTLCDLASQGFVSGDKAKVLVNMTYYDPKAGATYSKLGFGDIFVTVT